MNWRDYIRRHLPPLDIPPEREAEIVDELAQQLEAAYDTALSSGATPAEARRRTESEVPDWAALANTLSRIESPRRPLSYDHQRWRVNPMNGLVQDFRDAARGLLQAPVYTGVALLILTLALALGTTVFAIVDSVVVRPLPYAAADRLVILKATVPPEGRETVEITYPDARDLGAAGIFEDYAAVLRFSGTTTITDPASRIEGFEVSPGFFSTLGVAPVLGRLLRPDDADPAREPIAILGYAFWQRLGAPADIIGRSIVINERPRTIAGVAPPGVRVDLIPGPADVFLPLTPQHPFAQSRGIRTFRVIGRLPAGVTLERASAAAATMAARLADTYPDSNRGRTFAIYPLHEEIARGPRKQLGLVAALVALVLLAAAINLTGLLVARAAGRGREMAVRAALGAGRWRLVRESMAEGVLLSAAGAAAAGALAQLIITALPSVPGLDLPRLADVTLDWRGFAVLTAAAAAIACGAGAVPLGVARRLDALTSLRTGHETTGRPALRLRSALIVGQTAFAFMLLAAAALLATSLRAVLAQPLGFDTSQVVTMRVAVPGARYPTREQTATLFYDLLDGLRAHPYVQAAGGVSTLPLAGSMGSGLAVRGREVPHAFRPTVGWQWVTPGYFAAMGMRIVAGRDFTAEDAARTSHVTVINQTFAQRHFPGENPIGQRVYFGGYSGPAPPEWHEVIGVVGDVRHGALEAAPDARAYDLFGQHWDRTFSLAIRTAEGPLQIAGLVRQLLAQRDPRLAVFAVRTTEDLVDAAVATRRLLVWLVSGLAGLGLTVSLVGLYGTLSYVVTQRRREMGVRLALGAQAGHVRGLIVRNGLQLTCAGLLCGLAGALGLRGIIESQLAFVSATHVPALAAAAAGLLLAAFIACLIPAARAVKIDPAAALRPETL